MITLFELRLELLAMLIAPLMAPAVVWLAEHAFATRRQRRTVARGGSYLSPQVSDKLLHRIQRGDLESKPAASALDGLSPRELQVLRLVAEGKTSKEIAVMLDLGLQTVRSYRKTMMKKLGVNNVAGLTQLALSAGLTHFATSEAEGHAE